MAKMEILPFSLLLIILVLYTINAKVKYKDQLLESPTSFAMISYCSIPL